MCVIFFYVNSNPPADGYKLILASNRDEFFARDTRPLTKWSGAEHVYGGIDLEPGREGGTWLAISGYDGIFKIGALLNLTGEPRHKDVLGRGMIVSDYVRSYGKDATIENYNRTLIAKCTKYNAFNFLSIEIGKTTVPARISLCSNEPPTVTTYDQKKCYGFGNSLPASPFEKVRRGQQRFQSIVDEFMVNAAAAATSSASNSHEHLMTECMHLLKCKEKFWPDGELKRRAPTWGEELSAINVNIPHAGYGSRTHTVILIDNNNKMHFYEETMDGLNPNGKWTMTHIEKQYFQD